MILLKQLMELFVIMALGYFMARKKILGGETVKDISWMIVNVTNPALILSGLDDIGGSIDIRSIGIALGLAIVIFLFLILLAEPLSRLFAMDKGETGTYKLMLVFSNFGFMGFPLIKTMFGAEGILYASVFCIPFDMLMYTYGVAVISREKQKLPLKNILNLGVIASLLLIAGILADIQLPEMLGEMISMLSGLTAPLSMMVIGAAMYGMPLAQTMRDKRMICFCVVRMVIIPVICSILLACFVRNNVLKGISVVLCSAPVASMCAMFTQQYGGSYELASRSVVATTLLSVVTMPVMFVIAGL